MLPPELLRRVKRIEITTRKLVTDVMTGQYKSLFKGSGVQFSEHRQYVPGDDVRHIDWKVSARSRDPLIKKYEEERELTVLLVVDVSGSASFGSSDKLKSEVIAEVGGMLAYAATHTGDKVGALLFAGEIEKIIPPKKGKQHVLRIIRDLLTHDPKTNKKASHKPDGVKGTDLAGALDAANRLMKHQGIVFVMSDFISDQYDRQLRRLARRNDVVAISISDEREKSLALNTHSFGTMMFLDPETGAEALIDTQSYVFKKWIKDFLSQQSLKMEDAFKGGRIEHLSITTKDDYVAAVVRFFQARSRRRR